LFVNRYRTAGLSVESDLPLPALPPDRDPPGECDVAIRQGPVPLRLAETTHEGPTWQLAGDSFLLRIPGLTRCLLSAGRSITYEMEDGTPPHEIVAFLIGPAIGILLHQRKRIVLHASAVCVGGKAVVFCGPSGIGKSTLAAALAQRGYPFLTDDLCTFVDGGDNAPAVQPDGREIKLWAQAIDRLDLSARRGEPVRSKLGKFYVAPGAASNKPLPLGALYALRRAHPGRPAGIEQPRNVVDAALLLRRDVYRPLLVRHLGQKADYFQAGSKIVENAGVFILTQKQDFGAIPDVVAMLERHWSDIGLAGPQP
jgi:hypothetical protein